MFSSLLQPLTGGQIEDTPWLDSLMIDWPTGQEAAYLIRNIFDFKLPSKTKSCQVQLDTVLLIVFYFIWC
jgi:hypothetical protein